MNKIKVTSFGNGYTAASGDSFTHGFTDGWGTLYVTDIEVDKSMRGKGIGRQLVNALIRASEAKRVYAVKIVPEAVAFWKSLGIKEGRNIFNAKQQLVDEREHYIKLHLKKQFENL